MATPAEIFKQIEVKYHEDREKIKAISREAEERVAVIEEFQKKREEYLLGTDLFEAFGFFTDLYINGRDGKAEAKKKAENIGLDQVKIEKWLLKMLDKIGKGVKTDFGTVYKTRKESVSVGEWDTFVEENLLKPISNAFFLGLPDDMNESTAMGLLELLNKTLHNMQLNLVNKAVNKTAVLEIMGELVEEEGKESRPNPPPLGVNYTAIATVGVRKK